MPSVDQTDTKQITAYDIFDHPDYDEGGYLCAECEEPKLQKTLRQLEGWDGEDVFDILDAIAFVQHELRWNDSSYPPELDDLVWRLDDIYRALTANQKSIDREFPFPKYKSFFIPIIEARNRSTLWCDPERGTILAIERDRTTAETSEGLR